MHRWMWIRCQSWPDSKVDRTWSLNHKNQSHMRTKCGHDRPSCHDVDYTDVPLTIRDNERMWTRSPKLTLSRLTFHSPRVDLDKNWWSWHYAKVDLVDLFAVWAFSGVGLGQNQHSRKWFWSKSKQSVYQNYAKWALSVPNAGQVGTSGGGAGPRVDLDTRSNCENWRSLNTDSIQSTVFKQVDNS